MLPSMFRQSLSLLTAAAGLLVSLAAGAQTVGVTATEVKIGTTMPFSGPVSSLGNTGRGLIGYVKLINDKGGVGGRKINLIALDDGYAPPKAVEMTRRLVEEDEVAFLFSPLGTATNSATIKYVTAKKVPHVAIMTGAPRLSNVKDFPYTTTGLPSYDVEGRIIAKYVLKEKPTARLGVLYQNDDLGKAAVTGIKDVYGSRFDTAVTAQSYETTDPTVDSQIVSLKTAGVDAVILATTPKFASQAIRKIHDMGWRPLVMLNIVSSSVTATIQPAGPEKAIGVISTVAYKDPDDPKWKGDAGVGLYRDFMSKYMAGMDASDVNYITGFNQGMLLEQILKQCGNDLSRENVLKQSTSVTDFPLPMLLPGIRMNTSATDHQLLTQLQLQRWNGKSWDLFGEVYSGSQP